MKCLDTFSGIGGWALAAHWMGWETVAFVEKDRFCGRVLNKNFPGVPVHDDIFTFSGKPFRDRIDILTGSTPCQPFSQAGQRKGSNDERHLFPEFLRVVQEVKPAWICLENVFGLLNIEDGRVFEAYNTSLESEGYSVQTVCIPASAIGAPHRRDRLWIVAHTKSEREHSGHREIQSTDGEISERYNDAESGNADLCDATDATGERPGETRQLRCDKPTQRTSGINSDDTNSAVSGRRKECKNGVRCREGIGERPRAGFGHDAWNRPWIEVATEFCRVSYGLSDELHESRMPDGRDNRVNRLKALGNSVIPQICYEIFKAIKYAESIHSNETERQEN